MTLQEIYAREAMAEAGITGTLKIVHAETPKTIVNGKDYGLLFPNRIFHNEPKDIDMLFIGLHTEKRAAWLANFPNATIIYTDRGRDEAIKGHDEYYWDLMSRAKYVLCPDGDFTWTYRFFEAVACGAVPIVENWCEMYNEFYCVYDLDYINDDAPMWPEWNKNELMARHTI